MSRIRSVHPGLWTDERFVCLSPFARLLLIGIWNECDDQGSFEWSPLKLKMRLLPADTADAAALLEELAGSGSVLRYEAAGRALGAVRNFCRYQRPKKPNSVYEQTDEVRNFVGTEARSTRDGGEPLSHQSRTGGEKSRQRKEGGGSKETTVSLGAAKRGTRLPSDFVVPEEWIAWAVSAGTPRAEAQRQAPLFVDHWAPKSGRDGVKSDWLATWRNWIRRAPQFERQGRGKPDREYLGI